MFLFDFPCDRIPNVILPSLNLELCQRVERVSEFRNLPGVLYLLRRERSFVRDSTRQKLSSRRSTTEEKAKQAYERMPGGSGMRRRYRFTEGSSLKDRLLRVFVTFVAPIVEEHDIGLCRVTGVLNAIYVAETGYVWPRVRIFVFAS